MTDCLTGKEAPKWCTVHRDTWPILSPHCNGWRKNEYEPKESWLGRRKMAEFRPPDRIVHGDFDPETATFGVQPKKKPLIYIAGSMKNRDGIRKVAEQLRSAGFEPFLDWIMPGEDTDSKWQEFEEAQGHTYLEALAAPHAWDVFNFDKTWLDKSDALLVVWPAGKSAHTEMGYMVGCGKPAFIYTPELPEKWDVMELFAAESPEDLHISNSMEKIIEWLKKAV